MVNAYIITGFLGAGKSSMLTNTIKNHFSDKKVAIIVNEFGDVGVDLDILKNVHSDVIQISDGCICCQMAEEFDSGVIEILNKYNPEILFVETSGVTEPFPIFLSLQNLGLCVEGVICICDAKNYSSYMHNSTAKYQVGGANILVLNKTDLVSDDALEQAKKDIIAYKKEHNIKNSLTGKTVFNNYILHTAQQGILGKDIFEGAYQIDEILSLAQEDNQHSHIIHDHIDRFVSNIQGDISFYDLDSLLKQLPKNIYRVKGMVRLSDVPTPLIVNYSFGNVSYDELNDYNDPSVLIFIGEDIHDDIHVLSDKFDFLTIAHTHTHGHDHNHTDDAHCH